jgi:uncharacterized protein
LSSKSAGWHGRYQERATLDKRPGATDDWGITQSDPFLPDDPSNLLVADPSRREPVVFDASGNRLAGHLYRPLGADPGRTTRGIVMCGPISSVKEQTVPHCGERFADAGYTVLTFDPSGFGESEGEPRFHDDPWRVISDYVDASAYLMSRTTSPRAGSRSSACAWAAATRSPSPRASDASSPARSVAGGYDMGGTFVRTMGVDGLRRICAS